MIAPNTDHQFGEYSLVARLATGGTSEVWLACATRDGRTSDCVVLKTLLPHLAADERFVHQFAAQARASMRLSHENIVRVHQVVTESATCGIAMEYVAGKTLRQVLTALGAIGQNMPVWLACNVAAAICRALAYAHELRDEEGNPIAVLHGDLSPENVMIGYEGPVKVLDFAVGCVESTVAATPALVRGRYAYMAPERVESMPLGVAGDVRCDLFSLGVVLFEMLTGRRPRGSDDDLTLVRKTLQSQEPLPKPSQVAAWIPPEIDEIVCRALNRDPDQRFASARDFEHALSQVPRVSLAPSDPRYPASLLRILFPEQDRPNWETDKRFSQITRAGPAVVAPSTVPPTTRRAGPGRPLPSWPIVRASRPAPRSESFPVAPELPSTPTTSVAQSVETGHDWDAAVRRARKHVGPAVETSANPSRLLRERPTAPSPPASAEHFFEQGLERLRAGDIDAARAAWEQALAIEPGHRRCRANLKLLNKRHGRGAQ